MSLSTQAKADHLSQVQLFRGVDRQALERIAERAGEISFESGSHIVSQGQIGNGLYVILSGSARVVRSDRELERLEAGDFFGELAVIDQQPRAAHVLADGPVTCLALASWDLLPLLAEEPAIALNLLQGLASRVRASSQHHHH